MVAIFGASLATIFDALMEPVAVRLGYWQWSGGVIPWFNYASWWLVSLSMLGLLGEVCAWTWAMSGVMILPCI